MVVSGRGVVVSGRGGVMPDPVAVRAGRGEARCRCRCRCRPRAAGGPRQALRHAAAARGRAAERARDLPM